MSASEEYDTAAANLMNYIADEPDPDKREKAQEALSALNAKQQEAGFDELSQRTSNLRALATRLEQLVSAIETGGPVSGAISAITQQVADLKRKAGGGL